MKTFFEVVASFIAFALVCVLSFACYSLWAYQCRVYPKGHPDFCCFGVSVNGRMHFIGKDTNCFHHHFVSIR